MRSQAVRSLGLLALATHLLAVSVGEANARVPPTLVTPAYTHLTPASSPPSWLLRLELAGVWEPGTDTGLAAGVTILTNTAPTYAGITAIGMRLGTPDDPLWASMLGLVVGAGQLSRGWHTEVTTPVGFQHGPNDEGPIFMPMAAVGYRFVDPVGSVRTRLDAPLRPRRGRDLAAHDPDLLRLGESHGAESKGLALRPASRALRPGTPSRWLGPTLAWFPQVLRINGQDGLQEYPDPRGRPVHAGHQGVGHQPVVGIQNPVGRRHDGVEVNPLRRSRCAQNPPRLLQPVVVAGHLGELAWSPGPVREVPPRGRPTLGWFPSASLSTGWLNPGGLQPVSGNRGWSTGRQLAALRREQRQEADPGATEKRPVSMGGPCGRTNPSERGGHRIHADTDHLGQLLERGTALAPSQSDNGVRNWVIHVPVQHRL